MIKGFKEFILRGNVIDLAVAVVIGAAFTAVVTSIVNNVFNPLLGSLTKNNALSEALTVPIGGAQIKFGAVLVAVINFLIIAVVVYFVFVYPLNVIKQRAERLRKKGVVEPEAPVTELDLLTEIRDLLQTQQAPPQATGKHADPLP